MSSLSAWNLRNSLQRILGDGARGKDCADVCEHLGMPLPSYRAWSRDDLLGHGLMVVMVVGGDFGF